MIQENSESISKKIIKFDNISLVPQHSGLWNCVLRVLTQSPDDFFLPGFYRAFAFSLQLLFFTVFESWDSSPMFYLMKELNKTSMWKELISPSILQANLVEIKERIQAQALQLKLFSSMRKSYKYEHLDSFDPIFEEEETDQKKIFGLEKVQKKIFSLKEEDEIVNEQEDEEKIEKTKLLDPFREYIKLIEYVIHHWIDNLLLNHGNEYVNELFVSYAQMIYTLKKEHENQMGEFLYRCILSRASIPLYSSPCNHRATLPLFPNLISQDEFLERLRIVSGTVLPDCFSDISKDSKKYLGKRKRSGQKSCICGRALMDENQENWMQGVVLAGSAFLYISKITNNLPGDIDLWILNNDYQILQKLIETIWNYIEKKLNGSEQVFLIHYWNIWTLVYPEKKCRFQFILTEETSAANVVRKFDFDCLRGYYNGLENGFLLPECLFAWKRKILSVPNYEFWSYRLEKIQQLQFKCDSLTLQSEKIISEKEFLETDQDKDQNQNQYQGENQNQKNLCGINPYSEEFVQSWKENRKSLKFVKLRKIQKETEYQMQHHKQSKFGWFYPSATMPIDQVQYLYEKAFPSSIFYSSLLSVMENLNGFQGLLSDFSKEQTQNSNEKKKKFLFLPTLDLVLIIVFFYVETINYLLSIFKWMINLKSNVFYRKFLLFFLQNCIGNKVLYSTIFIFHLNHIFTVIWKENVIF